MTASRLMTIRINNVRTAQSTFFLRQIHDNSLPDNSGMIRIQESPTDLTSSWYKHHLFLLGLDKIKLCVYQKLSHFHTQVGGGAIKSVVSDLVLFAKTECVSHPKILEHVGGSVELSSCRQNNRKLDVRSFYVQVAYKLLTEDESKVDTLADALLELYLELRGHKLTLNAPVNAQEKQILRLAAKYYKSSSINYRLLYDHKSYPRTIDIADQSLTIHLPPLPQIKSKHLLAKALMHKELYRAVFLPDHDFYKTLVSNNVSIDRLALNVIRYDLLVLDGLGDLFLAGESSEFLYKFRHLDPYSADDTFGKKTYNLLRTILATNTLLSRLAVAYNLHSALDDDIVCEMLEHEYIPYMAGHRDIEPPTCQARYEEEFIADYFEQYVGALYLEQPVVAKAWINQLFEQILFSITDSYRIKHRKRSLVQYDYRAWGVDVIGRPLK